MTAEEIAATFGIALAMIGTADISGLFVRLAFGCFGKRGILASGAGLGACMTTGQDQPTRYVANDFRWVLPALHLVLMLAGGQLAGDLGSAGDSRWILLLVA